MAISADYYANLTDDIGNRTTDDGSVVLNVSMTSFCAVGWWYPVGSTQDRGGIFGNWFAGNDLVILRTNTTASGLEAYIKTGSTTYGPATSAGYSYDAWHGVAYRWNGSNITNFLDGVQASNITATGTLAANSTYNFRFGWYGTSQRTHACRLSQWAVWTTNPIPSDAQIAQMTLGRGHPFHYKPNHFWPFWETSGASVRDWIGGATLTMAAGTTPSNAAVNTAFLPFPDSGAGDLFIESNAVGSGLITSLKTSRLRLVA